MQWNKFGLVAVGMLALTFGATSVASAERGGSEGSHGAGTLVTASSTPATICASASTVHSGVTLGTLWLGNTLPERAQAMIGRVIVHLASPEPPTTTSTPGTTPGQTARERITAHCREFLAKQPAPTGPRAEFCQRVIAGTLTADDLKRIEQGRSGEPRERGERPTGPAANGQSGQSGRRA